MIPAERALLLSLGRLECARQETEDTASAWPSTEHVEAARRAMAAIAAEVRDAVAELTAIEAPSAPRLVVDIPNESCGCPTNVAGRKLHLWMCQWYLPGPEDFVDRPPAA